ncbi:ATPase family gene 2 protein homolog B-like [Ptychodera flava]|uniref:ATPase family gene 2 protein homolog B-like n=1 Tax=Ptychodera flava TaxID=63121 RepID=UPI00396A3A20
MATTVNDDYLRVIPVKPKCVGTQKCNVGPKTMTELKINIGSWMLLQLLDYKVLCQVWPRQDLQDGYLQYDACVSSKHDSVMFDKSLLTNMNIKSHNLIPIQQVSRVSNLNLTLIVEKYVDMPAENGHDKDSFLSDHIKYCLLNHAVFKNCIIDIKSMSALTHKCTKISNIVVEDFDLSSQKDVTSLEMNQQSDLPLIGLVTMTTKVNICKRMSKERFEQQTSKERYQLGGLEDAESMLKELISYPFDFPLSFASLGLECPKGILLQGPPGVGKTLLVKSVCSECNAFLININAPEVFNPEPGVSEEILQNAFRKANNLATEGPTVLFMDELDALCPKRSHGKQGLENRIVAQLLTLMDGIENRGKLIVIGATNRANAVDSALRRPGRFDREVIIGVPNVAQRKEILKVHTKMLTLAEDVNMQKVAEMTNGYVGADIAAFCREASFNALSRLAVHVNDFPESLLVNMSDFKRAINKIVPSTQRGSDALVEFKAVSWDDIGGLEDVKKQMQQTVEWPLKYPASFRRLGIPSPKGVLLYGPPGCCKTTLVKAAASACSATFLAISGAQLYSPYVGDSEKYIAEIFQRARLGAPAIIFLDEVDSIVGKRSTDSKSGHKVQERVLATLLNEMDGISQSLSENKELRKDRIEGEKYPDRQEKESIHSVSNDDILLIAATNRPDLVDRALLRPGRIDKAIYVPPPDLQARLQILSIFTKNMPLSGDIDLSDIAQKTSSYFGADLQNLCREAALISLQEDGLKTPLIKNCHFMSSLEASKPTLNETQMKYYLDMLNKT